MASVIGVFGALLVAVLAMMWRSITDLGREIRQNGDRLVRPKSKYGIWKSRYGT